MLLANSMHETGQPMLGSLQEPENGVDAEETDKLLVDANASVVSMYGSVSAWLLLGLVAALAGSTALYLGLSGEHRALLMPCMFLLRPADHANLPFFLQ